MISTVSLSLPADAATSPFRHREPARQQATGQIGLPHQVIEHGTRLGIDVEVVHRDPAAKGFKMIPRRRVVERTLGPLMHHRRLARDYETRPHRSEAMIRLMSRRRTRESALNRHNT